MISQSFLNLIFMYTIAELRAFYLKNKRAYSHETQNKIAYLFNLLKGEFGDCAYVHEVEELIFNS